LLLVTVLAAGGYMLFATRSPPPPAPVGDQNGRDEAAKVQAKRQRAEEASRQRAEAEARQKAQAQARPGALEPAAPSSVPEIAVVPVPNTDLAKIDRALEALDAAKAAFNTPDHARAGTPISVEVVLSTHLSPEKLKSLVVQSGGQVTLADLKISDRMVATLSGGSAFDISPTTPTEQWISEKEPTRWAWIVTPKAVGEQFLILSFDAVISIDGKDDKRSITTLRRRIDVEVGWPETWGEWLELARKTAEDISYLWAAILLPIGAGAWALFKHNRTTKTNGRDGDAIC
jgi:hypothetical protein